MRPTLPGCELQRILPTSFHQKQLHPLPLLVALLLLQVRAHKRVRVKGRFAKGGSPTPGPPGAEALPHAATGAAGGAVEGTATNEELGVGVGDNPAGSTVAQLCTAGQSEELTEVRTRAAPGRGLLACQTVTREGRSTA
jgi:hypothetical protein